MKLHIYTIVLSISLLLGACAGQGRLVQEPRVVTDFKAIVFETDGILKITQGDSETLTIEAGEEILPKIDTEVNDGILTIQFMDESGDSPLKTHRITYSLVVKDLETLQVVGKGMVNITNLNTDHFRVRINGSAIVSATGAVNSQEIVIEGMGHYQAPDLVSDDTKVSDDYGLATVWATKLLDVTLTSMGKVYYYGSPEVIQSVSGGGKIFSKGNK